MAVGFGRVFLGLFRELVRGQVVAFSVCNSGSLVSVGGMIVKFRGSVVVTLRHIESPQLHVPQVRCLLSLPHRLLLTAHP